MTTPSPPTSPEIEDAPPQEQGRDSVSRWIAVAAVGIPTLIILILMLGFLQPGTTVLDSFPYINVDFRSPTLLLANTPTGGDMGAHVLLPQILKEDLLPSGQILGFSSSWYAGFPVLYFYFPLPAIITVLLDVLLPYGVAFKLTTIIGLLMLPASCYFFVRSLGFARVVASMAAVTGSMFVFMESFSIFGGNIKSTLAGEFSFSLSLALSLIYLGLVVRDTRERRRFSPLAAVVLALAALSHIVTTIVVVVAALPLLLRRGGPRVVLSSWGLGFALSAFWAVPLAVRTFDGLTTDMGWSPVKGLLGESSSPGIVSTPFPDEFIPIVVLALLGAVWSLLRREDVSVLLTMTIVPLFGYLFLPVVGVTKLYNARLLPYWFLGGFLLAGIAIGLGVMTLSRVFPQRRQNLIAGSALAVLVLTNVIVFGVHDLPGWVSWNYTGYEGKEPYPEYRALLESVDELPPGRIMWEINSEQNRYGTPMALMLIPYWSDDHQSMEGVFFESSVTTPFHFLNGSEVSRSPSNPVRGLNYRGMDFERAVEHLELYDVQHYISFTDEARDAAVAAGLPVLAEPSPWTVFDLRQSEAVVPLAYEPVVYDGEKGFLDIALEWYDDIDGLDRFVALDGPEDWRRVQEPSARFTTPPYDTAGANVSDIVIEDQRITFSTDAIGVPHLVKVSYFPNWEVVSGGEGPYPVTPSLMLVVPTDEDVVLEFRATPVENIGTVLTLAGVGFIVVWWVLRRRRRNQAAQEQAA